MRVARWQGALVGALFASGVGLYVGTHEFFLLATIPLAYAVYGLSTGLGPPSLSVERTISADHTDPGDPVTVRLTVENVGDRPIPDLRIIDGVPEDVPVVEGSDAACVALRPGETATIQYDVLPPRGSHEFGPVIVRGRSLAGTVVGTTSIDPDGASVVTCDTLLDSFPLRAETTRFTGDHPTDAGGQGTEFYALREYKRGDSLSRIDWRRLARTGELATITFREERSVAVVFVIDARAEVELQPRQGGPSATDLSIDAAAQGFVTLTEAGHQVGVTTLTPRSERDWVAPGRGETTRILADDLFERLQGDEPPGRPTSTSGPAGPGGNQPPDATGDGTATDDGTATGGEADTDDTVAADGAGPGATDDEAVTTDDAPGGEHGVDGTELGLRLAKRLPGHAQVVLCTPLVDDVPVEAVETLLADHHDVTVLSPNVTGSLPDQDPTPGQAVMDIARRTRIADLQRLGVPTTDWQPQTPLQVALADMLTASRGWDR